MKKMIQTLLLGLFFVIIGMNAVPLPGQIVEIVEVEGHIVSDEPQSKNLLVISSEDLERMNVRNFGDLFSMFTSLNVSRRGTFDTSFDVGMRGSNFQQVLILVNGVSFQNPQTGHFNGDLPFSIQDIEKVEIIRGGSSTRYGAGAFAGVVNIILKRDSGFRFQAVTGDNRFFAAGLEAGKRLGDVSLRISLDRSNTSGYYEGRDSEQTKLSAGIFFEDEDTRLDLQAGYLDKSFGARGFYAPYPSTEAVNSLFYQLGWRQTINAFDINLSYSYKTHDDFFVLDRDNPHYFENETQSTIRSLDLAAVYHGDNWTAVMGAEARTEAMDSLTMGRHNRTHGAMFLNLNLHLFHEGGFDLGVRHNFIPNGQSHTTVFSGIFLKINRNTAFRVNYGTSFRLPSYTELYYNSPANVGNPELKPEKSRNTEASLTFTKGAYLLDFTVFHRTQRNLLDWIKTEPSAPWVAINYNSNNIYGIELTQQFILKKTTFTLGFERLFVTSHERGFISKYGLRFPDVSVKVNARQEVGKFLRLTTNYNFKTIYDTKERGHFLDVILAVPLGKLEISARIDNVFGTKIEEIPGVPTSGRWMYISILFR